MIAVRFQLGTCACGHVVRTYERTSWPLGPNKCSQGALPRTCSMVMRLFGASLSSSVISMPMSPIREESVSYVAIDKILDAVYREMRARSHQRVPSEKTACPV